MRNIQALIDTNIVLDWLIYREPFGENGKYIMEQCIFGEVDGYLTSHTLSDLFYILRKNFDVEKRKKLLLFLCERMNIIPEDKETIEKALNCEKWNDLEDGLQMQCAKNEDLDYIVTRNIKDFTASSVLPVLLGQFIEICKNWKV